MRKEFRLRKQSDFKAAYKKGKRSLSPCFVLYIHKNSLPLSRVGVSISKRHFKLATQRARLKRVAKELFRKKINPVSAGYDFVLASRAACRGKHINEAAKEIKCLILRLKKNEDDTKTPAGYNKVLP